MGDIPPSLHPFANPTRKPVMAMDQIIVKPIMFPEVFNFTRELSKMRINGQLLYFFFLSRPKMDKADIFTKFYNLIVYRLVSTGIDINQVSSPSEFTAKLPDINAHTPCIFPSQLAQGTAVNTKHGYL
jgi:hypothetical protein